MTVFLSARVSFTPARPTRSWILSRLALAGMPLMCWYRPQKLSDIWQCLGTNSDPKRPVRPWFSKAWASPAEATKARRCPGQTHGCHGKAARCPGKPGRSRVVPPDTSATSATHVKLRIDWLSFSHTTYFIQYSSCVRVFDCCAFGWLLYNSPLF